MLLECSRRVGRGGGWMLLRILRLCWPPAWTQHDLEVACSLMAVLTFCGMAAILYMHGTPQDKDPDLDLSEQHRDKLIQDLLKAKGWKLVREDDMYDEVNLVKPGDYPDEIEALEAGTRKPRFKVVEEHRQEEQWHRTVARARQDKDRNRVMKNSQEFKQLHKPPIKNASQNQLVISPAADKLELLKKKSYDALQNKKDMLLKRKGFVKLGESEDLAKTVYKKIMPWKEAPENYNFSPSPNASVPWLYLDPDSVLAKVSKASNLKVPLNITNVEVPKVRDTELDAAKAHKLLHIFNKPKQEVRPVVPSGDKYLHKVDLNEDVKENYECVSLNIKPPTKVCLYPTSMDVHLSYHIRNEGIWEPHIVKEMQNILYSNPDIGLIDIGANIGVYSLMAATMGHPVVAVEPYSENIKHLQKAAQINNVTSRITVLQNAVSDHRDQLILELPFDNQGGVALKQKCEGTKCDSTQSILMDDLLSVIHFKKAIIKIDIEGHEHRAFKKATELIDRLYMPCIFMEWLKLKHYYGSEITDTEDKSLTFDLVKFLLSRNYSAYSIVTGFRLKPGLWYSWPDDIIWRHELHDIL